MRLNKSSNPFFLPNNCSAPPAIAPDMPALLPDCNNTVAIKPNAAITCSTVIKAFILPSPPIPLKRIYSSTIVSGTQLRLPFLRYTGKGQTTLRHFNKLKYFANISGSPSLGSKNYPLFFSQTDQSVLIGGFKGTPPEELSPTTNTDFLSGSILSGSLDNMQSYGFRL